MKPILFGLLIIATILGLTFIYLAYAEIIRNLVNSGWFLMWILVSWVFFSLMFILYSNRFKFSNYDRLVVRMGIVVITFLFSPAVILLLNDLSVSSESQLVNISAIESITQSRFGTLEESDPDYYRSKLRVDGEDIYVFHSYIPEEKEIKLIEHTGMLGIKYLELEE